MAGTINQDALREYNQVTTTRAEPVPLEEGGGSLYIAYNTYDVSSVTAVLSDSSELALDTIINKQVRRPYRGISIKQESYASLSVVSGRTSLASRKLANSSTEKDVAFTSNFLINSVSETRQEKHQPVSTFGKDYVYFFGEQPRQMTFNVTLLNSENFRWEEEWWYNYEEYFRGTRLAARSEQIRLRLDESVIYGYMITCNTNKDSNNPHVVSLSFTVHVVSIVSTRPTMIGSHKIQEGLAQAYGNVDLNAIDVGDVPTITIGKDSQALRDYNMSKYLEEVAGPEGAFAGTVHRIKNTLKNWSDTISSKHQAFVDYIYGRNIVLPADAAYAQFSAGNPTFAEGTEAFEVLQEKGLLGETAVYGKGTGRIPFESRSTGSYTDNVDEYPFKGYEVTAQAGIGSVYGVMVGPDSGSTLTSRLIDRISEEFNIDKEDLTASPDGVIEDRPQSFLQSVSDTYSKSGAAFASFQVGIAAGNSAVRREAYKEGRYKVFPNEVFSSGLQATQFTQ